MEATQGSLMGGPSAFCISEGQLRSAYQLADEHPESSLRIQAELARIEENLSRNERAALAFILIERLRHVKHP